MFSRHYFHVAGLDTAAPTKQVKFRDYIWLDMKKFLIWLLFLIGILIPGCRVRQVFNTREFVPENILLNKGAAYLWSVGDLDNSKRDHLLLATKFISLDALLMLDQNGKELSQINFQHKLRNISVLESPEGDNAWLFASLNDQKSVRIMAWQYQWEDMLTRHEKQFEPIARTDILIDDPAYEWTAVLVPKLLEDIDNDGRLELVCLAIDGFTINPRGLAVYDFESGELKWRLELSTCVVSVICGDFNGDGAKELVCGTQAYKNTDLELHGMNDMNSWLFVVNSRGELVHREKAIEGYSQVLLATADVNKDGDPEILVVKSNKGNSTMPSGISWMKWTGNRFVPLKNWMADKPFELAGNAPILNQMNSKDQYLILASALNSPLIALDQDLNPVHHSLKEQITRVWAVEDLDLDGNKEVLVQTADNNFMILNSSLKQVAKLPNPWPPEKGVQAHIVHSGSGEPPRVALSSGPELRFYSYQRVALWGMVWNFIRANKVNLHILIFIIIVSLTAQIIFRIRLWNIGMNSLDEGIILVDRDDSVIKINRYLIDLLGDNQGKPPSKSLSALYPQISALLPEFFRSKALEFNTVLSLGPSELRHAAQFRRLRGLISGCLITLSPEGLARETEPGCIDCTQSSKNFYLNARRHIVRMNQALKPLQESIGDSENPNLVTIRNEIHNFQKLANAFQRFHETMDYQLRPLNLLPSVKLCLEHLEIPANIELTTDWTKETIQAWFEPARFEEALSNILINALEAMPDGGNLHVALKELDSEDPRVEIIVRDSGIGIPDNQLNDVWKPFFTTKEDGIGIGLPEARKIIEAMGGSLNLQSEEGRGTTVVLVIKGAESNGVQ